MLDCNFFYVFEVWLKKPTILVFSQMPLQLLRVMSELWGHEQFVWGMGQASSFSGAVFANLIPKVYV